MNFVNINHNTTNKVYKYSCLSDRQARDFSFLKRDSSSGTSTIVLGLSPKPSSYIEVLEENSCRFDVIVDKFMPLVVHTIDVWSSQQNG